MHKNHIHAWKACVKPIVDAPDGGLMELDSMPYACIPDDIWDTVILPESMEDVRWIEWKVDAVQIGSFIDESFDGIISAYTARRVVNRIPTK